MEKNLIKALDELKELHEELKKDNEELERYIEEMEKRDKKRNEEIEALFKLYDSLSISL